ncbi:MAG: KH domain-containing protein [Promethearchaeota archaeon]
MSFKDEEQGIKDNNQEEEEEAVNTEEDSDPDEFEDEETTRNLVVPGEILTTDTKTYLPGRGTLNIGLKQTKKNYINVIPLRGFYTPRPGDKVLAMVTDKNPVKYRCDINAKEDAILKPKNTMKRGRISRGMRGGPPDRNDSNTDMFNIGDILIAKILSADRLNSPELTTVGKYLGKKNNGIVISIDPPKIPRVIGREGSMIKNLKNLTKSTIFVTQNGRIWLKAEDIAHERLLVDAIRKIEREAHTVGLTDRMVDYIENEKKKRGLK